MCLFLWRPLLTWPRDSYPISIPAVIAHQQVQPTRRTAANKRQLFIKQVTRMPSRKRNSSSSGSRSPIRTRWKTLTCDDNKDRASTGKRLRYRKRTKGNGNRTVPWQQRLLARSRQTPIKRLFENTIRHPALLPSLSLKEEQCDE